MAPLTGPKGVLLLVLVLQAVAACSQDSPKRSDAPPAAAVVAALPAPAGSSAAVAACGTKPNPDCPLQAWMKGNPASRLNARDGAGLEAAFRRMIAFAPPGFDGWTATAQAGESAAKKGDIEGARAACKSCHEQHRDTYRTTMRARPVPPG